MRLIYEEHHEPAQGRFKNAFVQDNVNQKVFIYDQEGSYLLIDATGLVEAAQQTLSISGSTITLSGGGGSVTVPIPTIDTSSFVPNTRTVAGKPLSANIALDIDDVDGLQVALDNATAAGFSGAYADLTGKPTLFTGAYADLTGKPTLFDGAYGSLTGAPMLGSLAALSTVTLTTNVTGVLPVGNGGTGLASLTTGNILAAGSSSTITQLATTGSGNVVRATSPTLVTPALGTPSSVTLSAATGLPLTTGVTGILPLANGGTGSASQNFLDLTTAQSKAGVLTLTSGLTLTGANILLDNARYVAFQGAAAAWKIGRNVVTAGGNQLTSNTIQALVTSNALEGFQILGNSNAAMFEVGNFAGGVGAAVYGTLSASGATTLQATTVAALTATSLKMGATTAGYVLTADAAGNYTPQAIPGGGGGAAITIQDEGSNLTTSPTSMNFVGAGVVATNTGGAVTVTIGAGTGFANPMTTAGDLIYGGSGGAATRLAAGTATQVLHGGATPVWGAVSLTADVSGVLGTANGGTGITALGTGVATFLGTPSSANLLAAVTDETGTGGLVFATSPTLVTPALGVATATTINKVTITAPTTNATLTLVQGSSLITAGAFATTLTSTATTNATLPAGTVTLVGTAATQTLTGKTYDGAIFTGSFRASYNTTARTTATTLTVTDSEYQEANATTAGFNITPPATTTAGIRFTVTKTDTTANAVTLVGSFSGITNPTLTVQYDRITFITTTTSGVFRTVASTQARTRAVTQTAHGFVVGNIVRRSTTPAWVKAIADGTANAANGLVIVTAVPDANTFIYQMPGSYVAGMTGLTDGTLYYLSPTTAGNITATAPTTVGQVAAPLFLADSTTTGIFANFLTQTIAAAGGSSINSLTEETATSLFMNNRSQYRGTINAASGTVYYYGFTPKTNMLISKISVNTSATGGSGLTLARAGIYSVNTSTGDLTLVASTPNDVTGFNAAYAGVQKGLTTSYNLVAGTRYMVGVLFVGTTPPQIIAAAAADDYGLNNRYAGFWERLAGTQASQTDLPASLADSAMSATGNGVGAILLV